MWKGKHPLFAHLASSHLELPLLAEIVRLLEHSVLSEFILIDRPRHPAGDIRRTPGVFGFVPRFTVLAVSFLAFFALLPLSMISLFLAIFAILPVAAAASALA